MSDDLLVVEIEGADSLLASLSGLRDQIPYATSVAINTTLNKAQDAIRGTLPGDFTLRRKAFIEKTIYRGKGDFATKRNLVGAVRVNPDRNFLAKFEEGGKKQSLSGKALAVPVFREANKMQVISKSSTLSLAHVMALIDHQGGRQVGPLKPVIRTSKKTGIKTIKARTPKSFFLAKSKKTGDTVVVQRSGKTTKVLWSFDKDIPLPASLHFTQTAMATATAVFPDEADAAIAQAIATMK